MKKKCSPLRDYLLNVEKEEKSSKMIIDFDKILTECVQDFQELNDFEKVEKLKDILLLLLKLVFGDNEIHIQFGQGYVNKTKCKEYGIKNE